MPNILIVNSPGPQGNVGDSQPFYQSASSATWLTTASLQISSSSSIIGLLNITGSSRITGSLNITGSSRITGSLNILGSSIITGSSNIVGSLTVTGISNLGDTNVGTLYGGIIYSANANNTYLWLRGTNDMQFGLHNNNMSFRFLVTGGNELMRLFGSGNLLIQSGSTFIDRGFKLDVSGSGRFSGNLTITGSDSNSLLVRGSGTTNSTFSANFVNSSAQETFQVRDDGAVKIGGGTFFHPFATSFQVNTLAGTELIRVSSTQMLVPSTFGNLGAGGLTINGNAGLTLSAVNGNIGTINIGNAIVNSVAYTNTTRDFLTLNQGWNAVAGSSNLTINALVLSNAINFTNSTGTNIARGLYVNPTLTSVPGYRAIETTTGSVIFNGGNVGIGVLSPNFTLDVSGSSEFIGNVLITGSATNSLLVRGSGTTSATTALLVQNSSASPSLTVLDNGFVGINTGSAAYNLDVNGTARVSGQTTIKGTTNNDTTNIFRVEQQNGNGRFLVNAAGQVVIAGDNFQSTENFIAIGRVFNPTSGTTTHTTLLVSPTINQTGGANGITRGLYIYPIITSAANFRAIETITGSVIFNGGNVGIGISSPNFRLDVSGSGNFTNNLTITGSATISNILTLTPQSPLPSGVPTSSFAVSSSVPPKPYFWDGSSWNALY